VKKILYEELAGITKQISGRMKEEGVVGSWFHVSWIMGFIVQLDNTYWFIVALFESRLSNSATIRINCYN
jgi:hypothetical protein